MKCRKPFTPWQYEVTFISMYQCSKQEVWSTQPVFCTHSLYSVHTACIPYTFLTESFCFGREEWDAAEARQRHGGCQQQVPGPGDGGEECRAHGAHRGAQPILFLHQLPETLCCKDSTLMCLTLIFAHIFYEDDSVRSVECVWDIHCIH